MAFKTGDGIHTANVGVWEKSVVTHSQVSPEDYVSELTQEGALGRQRIERHWLTLLGSQSLHAGSGPALGAGNSDSEWRQQSTRSVCVLPVTAHLLPSPTHICPLPYRGPSSKVPLSSGTSPGLIQMGVFQETLITTAV